MSNLCNSQIPQLAYKEIHDILEDRITIEIRGDWWFHRFVDLSQS